MSFSAHVVSHKHVLLECNYFSYKCLILVLNKNTLDTYFKVFDRSAIAPH